MINELIEQIGGRERLETILTWREKYAAPSRISLPLEEVEAMARALLAVLNAKPVGVTISPTLAAMDEVNEIGVDVYTTPQ